MATVCFGATAAGCVAASGTAVTAFAFVAGLLCAARSLRPLFVSLEQQQLSVWQPLQLRTPLHIRQGPIHVALLMFALAQCLLIQQLASVKQCASVQHFWSSFIVVHHHGRHG